MTPTFTDTSIMYVRESGAALLLQIEDDNYAEHWVPKSAVRDAEYLDAESETAEIADWWLKKNSLL